MNKEQATQILIRCVEVAQEKGAYSLNDARLILQAIDALKAIPKEEKKANIPAKENSEQIGEKLEKPTPVVAEVVA